MTTLNKKQQIENFIASLPSFDKPASVGEYFAKLPQGEWDYFKSLVEDRALQFFVASDLQGMIGDGIKIDGTTIAVKDSRYPEAVRANLLEWLQQGYTRNKLYTAVYPSVGETSTAKAGKDKFVPDFEKLKKLAIEKCTTKESKKRLADSTIEQCEIALAKAIEKVPSHPLVIAYQELKAAWETERAAKQEQIDAQIDDLLNI